MVSTPIFRGLMLCLSLPPLVGCAGLGEIMVDFARAAGEAQNTVDAMNQGGRGYINNPALICSPANGAPPGTMVCR